MVYRRLVVVFCCVFVTAGCSSGPSKEALLSIEQYMDCEKVELIMGKPLHVRYDKFGSSSEVVSWDYKVAGENWTIMFSKGGTLPGNEGSFMTLGNGTKKDPSWGEASRMKAFSDFLCN